MMTTLQSRAWDRATPSCACVSKNHCQVPAILRCLSGLADTCAQGQGSLYGGCHPALVLSVWHIPWRKRSRIPHPFCREPGFLGVLSVAQAHGALPCLFASSWDKLINNTNSGPSLVYLLSRMFSLFLLGFWFNSVFLCPQIPTQCLNTVVF